MVEETGAKWSNEGGERTHVCIEATARYGDEVAEFLAKKGYSVSMVNPSRVKAYGESQMKRNKTDREDAKVIAHFCQTQNPAEWNPPSAAQKELQALTRHRETLQEEQTRIKNRLGSKIPSKTVIRALNKQLKFVKGQLKQIDAEIDTHIKKHPELADKAEKLVSIPGIGRTTAAILIAEMPEINRFNNVRQLVAFAGLSPHNHQSGSSINRPGRLVKTGQKRLRTSLYMPALTAIKHNPIIRSFAQRLERGGHCKMSIIGAAMRKLLHLVYGILKTGCLFDPNHLNKRPTQYPLQPQPI